MGYLGHSVPIALSGVCGFLVKILGISEIRFKFPQCRSNPYTNSAKLPYLLNRLRKVVKLKMCEYAYLHIFSLTISRSQGHSHFKSAFRISFRLRKVVKLKIRKYAYLRIFSLTTSGSQKFIPKEDLI